MNTTTPFVPTITDSLIEKATQVYQESLRLHSSIHPENHATIKKLLAHVHSYYSNQIEGHFTYLSDIKKMLAEKYVTGELKNKRTLDLHQAHLKTEQFLDVNALQLFKAKSYLNTHKAFYDFLNDDKELWVTSEDKTKSFKMVPGEFRKFNVHVGNHVAPEPSEVAPLMQTFEAAYSKSERFVESFIKIAAAHHRFSYIHPFLDGNGRVNRLMTTYQLKQILGEVNLLWSLNRGLARSRQAYYNALSHADSPRMGDLDGRGNLSLQALGHFVHFIFDTCLDQIQFMQSLLNLNGLIGRIEKYITHVNNGFINHPKLRPETFIVLKEVILLGSLERGKVASLTGLGERTARSLTSELLRMGFFESESHRSVLKWAIPIQAVPYWFPDLYGGNQEF